MPRLVTCERKQLSFVSNFATTGHKLQGASLDQILVNDWHYGENWAYVVLSRARTRDGLFLRTPLDTDLSKYKPCPELDAMLKKFKEERNIGLSDLTDEEYDDILRRSV